MSNFKEWLARFFDITGKNSISLSSKEFEVTNDFDIWMLAIQSAVRILAAAVSQSTFRTFIDAKEVKAAEYYLWNFEPNKNQNSTEFLFDLVETIIYNSEALILEERGQMFIADEFCTVKNGTKPNAYTGITVNGASLKDRTEKDVLHFRFGKRDIALLLRSVCTRYEEIIETAISTYEKNGADKGILNVDAAKRGRLDDEKYEQDLMQNKFKAFFGAKNSVLPLHAGYTYTPHKRELRNTSEVNDIKTITDEVINRVGQVFGVPPTLIKGEIAQNNEAIDSLVKFGVRPILDMLEEEITRKRFGYKNFTEGSRLSIDTSMLEISGIFASADKLDKIIGSGILTIDEVREKVGEQAVGEEVTSTHFVTKNYGVPGTEKGGENE